MEVFRKRLSEWPESELQEWRENTQDYRNLYAKAKDIHLAVSPRTANLLYVLAKARRARTIVEFGTSFGYSTLHLAAALKDNGGGRLISTEFEPSKVAQARRTLEKAELSEIVEIREGDALDTLAHDLPDRVDFVFLDGAGTLYRTITELLEPRLSPDAVVVADNAHGAEDYLAHVRSPGRYVSTSPDRDIELSLWLRPTSDAG
ncbi:O-methyltransferase [Amycolatopsis sp. lyj-109]|uniref:O-methyltransferase n=1 Tax=Amycolatopsis sp. lyj-109 TaxID=2789287 RepID=UPI00397D147F